MGGALCRQVATYCASSGALTTLSTPQGGYPGAVAVRGQSYLDLIWGERRRGRAMSKEEVEG